jgi:uncharacterized protein YbjT (DUF2867 family)
MRERGERVRAFVRDPLQARAKLGDGVELAVGDFDDRRSVRGALEGVDDVVLSCAAIRAGWHGRRARSTPRRRRACGAS